MHTNGKMNSSHMRSIIFGSMTTELYQRGEVKYVSISGTAGKTETSTVQTDYTLLS